MNLTQLYLVVLFGLAIGSFLNVLIYRLNTAGAPSPLSGRSFCPACRHILSPADLVPVISYLFLGGRCRYCRRSISPVYPLVELACAGGFTAIFLRGGSLVDLAVGMVLIALLVVILASDWIYGLIPDEMVLGVALLGIAANKLRPELLLPGLLAGSIIALVGSLMIVISRGRAMGWGDVKLFIAMGMVLGWPGIVLAIWLAFVVGGVTAVGLLVLRRKKFGATIPLGPYLVGGTAVSFFYGSQILEKIGWLYPH